MVMVKVGLELVLMLEPGLGSFSLRFNVYFPGEPGLAGVY